jgi:arylsulfatase A-like enzyme
MYVKGVKGTWATLRTEEWKLIRIPHPEKDIFELYNIKTDPQEQNNLYQSNPDQAQTLTTILDSIKTRLPDHSLITPQQQQLDEETRETLKSLGYLTE